MKVSDEEVKNFYHVGKPSAGFRIVQRVKEGKWQYLSMDNELSQEYQNISDYHKGCGVVQLEPKGKWFCVNTNGMLSDQSFNSFYDARECDRNALTFGVIEQLRTGKSIYELEPRQIFEKIDEVKDEINRECQEALNSCSTSEEKEAVISHFTEIADYTKALAYEEYLKWLEETKYDNINVF